MRFLIAPLFGCIRVSLVLALASVPSTSQAWGAWGHRRITRAAVYALPDALRPLYKRHLSYLEAQCLVPDRRRYADPREAPRHYLDLEFYAPALRDTGVLRFSHAVAHFGPDSLRRHGELPWAIHRVYLQLVEAFRQRQTARALKLSAELSHYLADAAVPLHTTANYDGQAADLRGIHVLWESTLPERFGERYSWQVPAAMTVDAPLATAWQLVRESHTRVDTLLDLAQRLRATTAADERLGYAARGRTTARSTSHDYAARYHALVGAMVEQRLKRAAQLVASYWRTAWVEAGQPDVSAVGQLTLDAPDDELPGAARQSASVCRD